MWRVWDGSWRLLWRNIGLATRPMCKCGYGNTELNWHYYYKVCSDHVSGHIFRYARRAIRVALVAVLKRRGVLSNRHNIAGWLQRRYVRLYFRLHRGSLVAWTAHCHELQANNIGPDFFDGITVRLQTSPMWTGTGTQWCCLYCFCFALSQIWWKVVYFLIHKFWITFLSTTRLPSGKKKQLVATFEIYDAHYFNDIPKSIYQPLLFDKSFHYSLWLRLTFSYHGTCFVANGSWTRQRICYY
jgi:hypothetical protein